MDQGLPEIKVLNSSFKLVNKFGKRGSGKGQLSVPKGIVTDPLGRIYISEALVHRFQVFSSSGEHLFTFGKKGKQAQEFNTVEAIAIDHAQNLFILDKGNNRIQQFKYTP